MIPYIFPKHVYKYFICYYPSCTYYYLSIVHTTYLSVLLTSILKTVFFSADKYSVLPYKKDDFNSLFDLLQKDMDQV